MNKVVAHFVGTKREFVKYLQKMHDISKKLAAKAEVNASKGEWHLYDRHMEAAVWWAELRNKHLK